MREYFHGYHSFCFECEMLEIYYEAKLCNLRKEWKRREEFAFCFGAFVVTMLCLAAFYLPSVL